MNDLHEEVISLFRQHTGSLPSLVVRSPGRVNLIGEHTDYNEGFVFPMAIESATWIALRPRPDQVIHLFSADHGESVHIHLDRIQRDAMNWREYPKGVVHTLQALGHNILGWEGVTLCDVPMGAGLSSSASFELAVARACTEVSGIPWDGKRMALAAQQAENEWVGVKCGIMDQLISALGREGHALFIDCRTLDAKPARLPSGTAVLILDTMTRRGLVESAYNERRAQCRVAAEHFGVTALRDVSLDTFAARAHELDPIVGKRARHVITENQRTCDAFDAMQRNDAAALGALMDASHASLRDDFEVTNPALNTMVSLVRSRDGCFGARMTGAGFGGCAVALVDAAHAESIAADTRTAYREASGHEPAIYISTPAEGTSSIPVAGAPQ